MIQQAYAKKSLNTDLPDISPAAFNLIMQEMKNRKDFNLGIYKENCIKRRIALRIKKTDCSSATEYANFLIRDENEADLLLKVLTVNVSHFFRNPATFDKLTEEILPYLIDLTEQQNRDSLKVWSVGCARGEEPYSTALILKKRFDDFLSRSKVGILADDIDREALEAAKQGHYREERLREVSREEKNRWFRFADGKFKLVPEIRNMVTFRHSDVCDVDNFPESDLILCRNVLIYLERNHQEKILKGFADALRNGGVLVLGRAESLVGESRSRFQTLCPVQRIYRVV